MHDLKRRFWRDSAQSRREALLPFIWGTVARRGQVFGDRSRSAPSRLTNGLKFSYPGYNEIFCGFGDARIDTNDKRTNPNRSVLEFLDCRAAFRGRVAAFCTWDVFSWIFRADQNSLKIQAGWTAIADEPLNDRQRMVNLMVERLPRYWPDNVYDAIIMESAREHLVRHRPRVLYIALGETDEWAHERRYDLYLHSAHEADRFLADLWRTVDEMPEYRDKTSLILTTDHGRGGRPADWTDHDRNVEGAEYVWIAVMGPVTPALGVREGVESTQSQVAATIAQLVGEDFLSESQRSAGPLPGVCPSGATGQPR
jgi:Type I phosphodiesterase / nucleotide pyrophosphatase